MRYVGIFVVIIGNHRLQKKKRGGGKSGENDVMNELMIESTLFYEGSRAHVKVKNTYSKYVDMHLPPVRECY